MNTARAASIHARLLNLARARREDFSLVLNRYAVERWLYRLSQSPQRERLWLKGALLFQLWFDVPHRPTRDADFLGIGPADAEELREAVQAICTVQADDGMRFDPGTVRVEEIREAARYAGLRGAAIAATFARRGTPLPEELPVGLTGEFAQDAARRAQWQAFLGKNGLAGPSLARVVTEVGEFVMEPLRHARAGRKRR